MSIWELRKSQIRQYSGRQPQLSPLYTLVSSAGEDLIRVWPEQFQAQYGALRDVVKESFERYLQCGILVHGCARAHCTNPECNHSELIPLSCKVRCFCPSCDAKKSCLFAENLVDNVLLPYPHQHCVCTVSKRIRPYFMFDRKNLQILYQADWEAWHELVEKQVPGGTTGAVLALHSASDNLAWHPHVHSINLAGAILPDGTFKPAKIDPQEFQALFEDKVLAALESTGLLSTDTVANIKTWPHSGFSAFIGDAIAPTDKEQLLFVARYLKKAPISNERLSIVEENGEAIVHYKSYRNGEESVRTFTPLEFLAQASLHIPNVWEQTSRFYGCYSARYRGAARAALELAAASNPAPPFGTLPVEPEQQTRSSWARLMKKFYEVDPLVCPKCGSQMVLKAFITQPSEIERICANLNIPPQRAPPKLHYSVPLAA